MRIQNNVPALNAHRFYTINNNGMTKSIAKLSSGYRINSAADDAAGLAISEKMRAQIRGLTMASKNAQDATSLIQTAEGGMQEIDNMIQRIRELVDYASNDTMEHNAFGTGDREKVQNEIDQLVKEIDSMSDRVEFNKKKLLNGELAGVPDDAATLLAKIAKDKKDLKTQQQSYATALKEFNDAATGASEARKSFADVFTNPEIDKYLNQISLNGGDQDNDSILGGDVAAGVKDVLEKLSDLRKAMDNASTVAGVTGAVKDAAGEVRSAMARLGSALNAEENDWDATAGTGVETIEFARSQFAGLSKILGGALDEAEDASYTSSLTGTWIKIGNTGVNENDYIQIGSSAYATLTNGLKSGANLFELKNAAGDSLGYATLDQINAAMAQLAQTNATALATARDGASVGNVDKSKVVDGDGVTATSDLDLSLVSANTAAGLGGTEGYTAVIWDISAAASFKDATGTALSAAKKISKTDVETLLSAIDDYIALANTTGLGTVDATFSTSSINLKIESVTEATALKTALGGDGDGTNRYIEVTAGNFMTKADLTAAISAARDAAGNLAAVETKISIANGTLANGASGAITNADSTQLAAAGWAPVSGSTPTHIKVGSGVVDVRASNTNRDADLEAALKAAYGTYTKTDAVDGNEPTDNLSTALKTLEANYTDYEAKRGALADELGALNDARAALALSQTELNAAPKTGGLYFQIGANANQGMQLYISSVKSDWLGIGDGNGVSTIRVLDSTGANISSQLETLDTALSYVTTERAKLGAAQNRLEYTMNSLDISAENLTAAESRIRDVDMAKEMSNFTRQNILFQASTAMLAQANSMPQGVLQLLG